MRASPTAISRPIQSSSSWAAAPLSSIDMRKRRASSARSPRIPPRSSITCRRPRIRNPLTGVEDRARTRISDSFITPLYTFHGASLPARLRRVREDSAAMQIADATDADLEEIVAIYNDAIVNSTAVFSDRPVTVEHQRRWLSSRIEAGQPVIVARAGDMVAGFGSYGPFRSWPGYRLTVEHSVYVHPERRRQGVGRELVRELLQRQRR